MKRPLQGEITLRGDKSLSHRALMFAALAQGKSRVRNLSLGADVAATAAVLGKLGVPITIRNGIATIDGHGLRAFRQPAAELYCANSGTTLRLMLGILAGSQLNCELTGDTSLSRRPVRRVMAPLLLMGADIQTRSDDDRPPARVAGRNLHGIDYTSPIASAQVKSAVLLAALAAEGSTTYTEPELSRDHTERWLQHAGAAIIRSDMRTALVPPVTLTAFEYDVPGDISTAAFFCVAASVIGSSRVVIKDVLVNPTRLGALELLRRMGARIQVSDSRLCANEPVGSLMIESSQLRGTDSDGIATASFIDEVPALAVAAIFASGTTRFRKVGELRVKESDRAQGIVDLARAFNCEATIEGEDLIVHGGAPRPSASADPRGDHRLAMAIEIATLALGGELGDRYQEMIAISAPEFYTTLRRLC